MSRILLEVCVASVDDALAAAVGGAGRLELNTALSLGGLTPSTGLVAEVLARVSLPVIAMVRPRPGGFAYSSSDFEVMLRDIDTFLKMGAAGIAFGVLRPTGEIDVDRCRRLREKCGSAEAVFHRAFDVTPDPSAALEKLIELGFRRVMTSGQEATAHDGSARIAGLFHQSAGRIEILPAGGITAFMVADVVARTGCDQVHASLRTTFVDMSVSARTHVRFGSALPSSEDRFDGTSEEAVRQMIATLNTDS